MCACALQFQARSLPLLALDVGLDLAEDLVPPPLVSALAGASHLSPRRVHTQASPWGPVSDRAGHDHGGSGPGAAAGAAAGGHHGGHRPGGPPHDVASTLPRVPVPSPIHHVGSEGEAGGDAGEGEDGGAYSSPRVKTFNSVQTSPGQLAGKAAEWLGLRPAQAHALVSAQRATG